MEWLKFAEQYGPASAGLAAVFWYVILPLKERHIKFLDSTEETNKSLARTVEKQAEILEGVQTGLDRMNTKIDKVTVENEATADEVGFGPQTGVT